LHATAKNNQQIVSADRKKKIINKFAKVHYTQKCVIIIMALIYYCYFQVFHIRFTAATTKTAARKKQQQRRSCQIAAGHLCHAAQKRIRESSRKKIMYMCKQRGN